MYLLAGKGLYNLVYIFQQVKCPLLLKTAQHLVLLCGRRVSLAWSLSSWPSLSYDDRACVFRPRGKIKLTRLRMNRFSQGSLNYEVVTQKLKYLRNVLDETLRIYSPVSKWVTIDVKSFPMLWFVAYSQTRKDTVRGCSARTLSFYINPV